MTKETIIDKNLTKWNKRNKKRKNRENDLNTFGTFAYCYCINSKGKKIEGYMRELHNGRSTNSRRDREIDEYRSIYSSLIFQMQDKPNFEDKFYGNL